jgi:acyl carrier protein
VNEKFLENFRTALDLDQSVQLKDDDLLANLAGWDSMAVISVIAFADFEYGKAVTGEQIAKCKTICDLAVLVE